MALYPRMKALNIVVVVVVCALSNAAQASECRRWLNYLNACEGVINQTDCNNSPSTWSELQRRQYNNWRYSTTPDKACSKLIRKRIFEDEDQAIKCPLEGPGGPKLFELGTWNAATEPYDAEGYLCTCDRNGDGITNATDLSSAAFQINKGTLQREPICELVPNGPYADMPDAWPFPASGGTFPDDMRQEILGANEYVNRGQIISDFWNIDRQYDYYSVIESSQTTYLPNHDDLDWDTATLPQKLNYLADFESVQIDHIIPRHDIQGCPCGMNTEANALVISGKLNSEMSNLTQHPARQAILKKWTNWMPGMPLVGEAPEIEEAPPPVDDATGGCSTSGSGGIALGLLAFVMRRRRVRARS